MTALSQFLYISRIAGDQAFETVLGIVRHARGANQQHGITGVLVFDGAHVCQYIEGEHDALERLAGAIADDPRHTEVRVLYQGPLDEERRFARFSMGYLLLDQGEGLGEFGTAQGLDAVRQLMETLPRVDLEP